MPETRLIVLGVITAAVVLVIVVGSAVMALGDSFRELHSARRDREERGPRVPPPSPPRKPARYTPARTRLRWYSPEILAVLLLTLAAGLWLARLVD
jgi:hypothetical protein